MSNSHKIKSHMDLGRGVRNFMDEEELETYKKFLPESRDVKSTAEILCSQEDGDEESSSI